MNKGAVISPELLEYAFWDTDIARLDLDRSKEFVISRIFDMGKLEDVLKAISYYGVEECKMILKENKYLQHDAIYLAHTLLSIPLEDFQAYDPHKSN